MDARTQFMNQVNGDPFAPFRQQIEAAVFQAQLVALITLVIVGAVFFWCLYHVVRASIRDGIRESGLIEATRQRAPTPTAERPTNQPLLPDMRAER